MKKNNISKIYSKNTLPKRIDKALEWLVNSRSKWKKKCMETKLQLKRQNFDSKRVRESRDDWKLRHIRLKQELIKNKQRTFSLQSRIDDLESQLDKQKNEILEVKKKR